MIRTSSGRLHRDRQICEVTFDFHLIQENGETKHVREQHGMRYFSESDLGRLLLEGGFELMNIGSVDEFEKGPDNSKRDMFVLAVAV